MINQIRSKIKTDLPCVVKIENKKINPKNPLMK